jgi:N-acetylglutamate synthase-like GNAT family acetyltransferase
VKKHSPTIRPYVSFDFNSVLELIRLNTPTYFSVEEEKDLADYLKNSIEDYYVIELNHQVIGSGGINYSEDKKKGIISWDMIHPEFQGKSLGKMLLNYRISIIKEIDSIEQISVRTSQLTYPFYEKSGFEIINIKKDYWAEGFDLYEMGYK